MLARVLALLTLSLLAMPLPADGATVRATSPSDSPAAVLIVGLRALTDLTRFSGTLIAPKWVITSRSCLYHNATRLTHFLVYAGGMDYQEYVDKKPANTSQLLSSYHTYIDNRHDVALLRMQGEFKRTKYVDFAPLATDPLKQFPSPISAKGKSSRIKMQCSVTSFGALDKNDSSFYRISDEKLVTVSPCFHSGPSCRVEYYYDWQWRWDLYICTDRSDDQSQAVCAAMPGSGLMCDGRLFAVTHIVVAIPTKHSCVVDTVEGNPCQYTNIVSVFTMAPPRVQWLNDIMFPKQYPFPGCNAFGGQGPMYRSGSPLLPSLLTLLWRLAAGCTAV